MLYIEKSKINLCWLERTSFRTYLCWKPRIIYNHLLFCLGQAAPVRLWFLFTASARRRRRNSRCQLWRRLRPAAALPAVVLPVRVPVHGRRGSGPHRHIVRGLAARAGRHPARERVRKKISLSFLMRILFSGKYFGSENWGRNIFEEIFSITICILPCGTSGFQSGQTYFHVYNSNTKLKIKKILSSQEKSDKTWQRTWCTTI